MCGWFVARRCQTSYHVRARSSCVSVICSLRLLFFQIRLRSLRLMGNRPFPLRPRSPSLPLSPPCMQSLPFQVRAPSRDTVDSCTEVNVGSAWHKMTVTDLGSEFVFVGPPPDAAAVAALAVAVRDKFVCLSECPCCCGVRHSYGGFYV